MQSEFNIILGKKIREIRRSCEISLNKLAEQLGVSYQQLQKYETGTNRISAEKLFEIGQFLRVEVACFFPDSAIKPTAALKDEMTGKIIAEIIEKLAQL